MALSSPALAQDVDTLYRAAYCVGVLKADLKWQETEENWALERSTREALCNLPKSRKPNGECAERSVEQRVQEQLREKEARRQRYAAYVLMRTDRKPSSYIAVLI